MFGTLIASHAIDAELEAVYRRWIDCYLAESARQQGDPSPASSPLSYSVGELARESEEQQPTLMISTAGTSDTQAEYTASTRGAPVSAWWRYTVGAMVRGQTESDTRRIGGHYGAAIRGVLFQKVAKECSLIRRVRWFQERVPPMEERRRSNLMVAVTFDVLVDEVVSAELGPADPGDCPGDEVPAWFTKVCLEDAVEPVDNLGG